MNSFGLSTSMLKYSTLGVSLLMLAGCAYGLIEESGSSANLGSGNGLGKYRQSKFKTEEFCITADDRIETITRLNDAGLKAMETKGCMACHPGGGLLPQIEVTKYFTTTTPKSSVVQKRALWINPSATANTLEVQTSGVSTITSAKEIIENSALYSDVSAEDEPTKMEL